MPAVTGIPRFSVRWTEPEGHLGKMQHSVEVDVTTPTDHRPLSGAITTSSAGYIGRLPAGGSVGESHFMRTDADLATAQSLWKTVQESNIRQWVPRATDAGAKLDRDAFEIVIDRARGRQEVYRADLRDAPAPVRDVIAAAAHVLAEQRLHHS